MAAKIQALQKGDCDGVPWRSPKELYDTIDEIQQGHAPFTTVRLKYSGPLPPDPPKWMTQEYELCLRDTRQVLHQQLATPQFAKEFDPAPYRQFQADGKRVWSNLMSAEWAWRKAVSAKHSYCTALTDTSPPHRMRYQRRTERQGVRC
jgi:hypothetical protein